MEIKSSAGEFGFDIEGLEIEGDELVLVGKMGVWEAKTHLTQADLLRLFGLMFGSVQFWKYMLRLPGFALSRRKRSRLKQGG